MILRKTGAATASTAALAFSILPMAAAWPADLAPGIAVSIKAQPLQTALLELSRQGHMQLVIDTRVLSNKVSKPVKGNMSIEVALDLLLKNTGLAYKIVGNHTIAIAKRTASPRPDCSRTSPAAPVNSANDNNPTGGGPKMIHRGLMARLASLVGLAVSAADPACAQSAQSTDHDSQAATPPPLEEVIVTGTAGGAGLRKQDASYTITTLQADDIEAAAPKSATELLVQIPGVWAETNGGVAGANVTILGFPDAGDSPHLTYAINGAPIFGAAQLPFFGHNWMFRLDESIASAEGLIGGPGSVFAQGNTGLTVNYRLKEGGEQTQGKVKYTGSDYDLRRVDALLSGKFTEGLYYMVAGYVQSSTGVRSPQFTSEKGTQLTANITKTLDNGKINLWTRITDDYGQGLVPFAANAGNKDLGTFTQLGDYSRFHQLGVGTDSAGNVTYRNFDFGKGLGWTGSVSGLSAEFETSENTVLRDNMSFTSGESYNYSLVPDGGAVQVSSLPASGPGAVLGPVTTRTSGQTLVGSDWVQNYGFWVVTKDLRSLTNDLSLEITTGPNQLTLGYYAAQWSAHDWWTLGNQVPFLNVAHGDLLDGNVTCASLQAAGSGSSCFRFGLEESGETTANAFYLADSYQVTPALRLDAGFRHERQSTDLTISTNDADYSFPSGVISQVVPHLSTSANSYTGAIDYAFSSQIGVFSRYTSGWTFPNMDQFRGSGFAALQRVKELEAGFKYTGPRWKLYTTLFTNKVDSNAQLQGANPGEPLPVVTNKAHGLLIDGAANFAGGFSMGVNATWQSSKYDSGPTSGNTFIRQPDVRVMLTPSYNFVAGDWSAVLYGTVAYIGSRFADAANTQSFPAYTTLDGGVRVFTPWGLTFQVVGQNITDRDDFTEGDPRGLITANSRPILGRSIQFSTSYEF